MGQWKHCYSVPSSHNRQDDTIYPRLFDHLSQQRQHTVYVPDFLVTYRTKDSTTRAELIEIKPRKQSVIEGKQSVHDRAAVAVNYAKWDAATKWAQRQGLMFRVINEDQIFHKGSK